MGKWTGPLFLGCLVHWLQSMTQMGINVQHFRLSACRVLDVRLTRDDAADLIHGSVPHIDERLANVGRNAPTPLPVEDSVSPTDVTRDVGWILLGYESVLRGDDWKLDIPPVCEGADLIEPVDQIGLVGVGRMPFQWHWALSLDAHLSILHHADIALRGSLLSSSVTSPTRYNGRPCGSVAWGSSRPRSAHLRIRSAEMGDPRSVTARAI